MLIRFRVGNYRCFKDEAIFDLRAVKAYKEHPENVIFPDKEEPVLKVASIYGANASGKSSFISAYNTFRSIVLNSFSQNGKESGAQGGLSKFYFPFLFNEQSTAADTEFEAVFQKENVEYRYGFIYNSKHIEYEWLYTLPVDSKRKTVTTVIERKGDNIKLGSSVKKSCEKYKQNIDEDVLALSFFRSLRLKNSVFHDAFNCVTSLLPLSSAVSGETSFFLDLFFRAYYDDGKKPTILKFLSAVDIQIKDIEVKRGADNIEVSTFHSMPDGSLKAVPLSVESDGTKKAIALISFIQRAISGNQGLMIDELDMQLHPLLIKYIVDLFYEQSTEGQLIYTAHDTSLLDKRYTRRDQIWFAEKNENGESSLHSLAEYKIRNDNSFARAYLGGAFGGIPNLKDFIFEEN